MSDIVSGISGLLSASWHFLMNTYIPATEIPLGVVFVGLCVMSLGFKFLSLVVGHSIGDPAEAAQSYNMIPKRWNTLKARISDARKNDVR